LNFVSQEYYSDDNNRLLKGRIKLPAARADGFPPGKDLEILMTKRQKFNEITLEI